MDQAVRLSHEVGHRIGEELGVPVYMYEHSAAFPERRNLAYLRRGEYEAIARKMKLPAWEPDYGPFEFNERSGVTAVGARNILVAFNINLSTTDIDTAERIAGIVRESGYRKDGRTFPGLLPGLKAIGWLMEGYGCAQVSTNICDTGKAPVSLVYETVREAAEQCGVRVAGSELIGLVPLEVLEEAGRYYESRDQNNKNENLTTLAIRHLGLSSLSDFSINDRIIESLL